MVAVVVAAVSLAGALPPSPVLPPSPLEVAVAAAAEPSPSPPPLSVPLEAGAFVARRSRFAQPEPLKWIVGATNALRTGPSPHSGHDVGPSSWMPWTTSKRREQAAQV